VDRFHVAKLYGKGLDELRKKELERLRKALPKEQSSVSAKIESIVFTGRVPCVQ
jgi:hypothetical protein